MRSFLSWVCCVGRCILFGVAFLGGLLDSQSRVSLSDAMVFGGIAVLALVAWCLFLCLVELKIFRANSEKLWSKPSMMAFPLKSGSPLQAPLIFGLFFVSAAMGRLVQGLREGFNGGGDFLLLALCGIGFLFGVAASLKIFQHKF